MTTGRKSRRKRRRREDTTREILDVARTILLEQGPTSLTVDAVARQLEVTKPAIYYYFKSKEELIFEVVVAIVGESAEHVATRVNETTSGVAAIEAMIDATLEYFAPRMHAFRLVYLHIQLADINGIRGVSDRLGRLRPLNDRLYGGVEERIQADIDNGTLPASTNPRRMAFAAHNAAVGLLTYHGIAVAAGEDHLHSLQQTRDELLAIMKFGFTTDRD